MRLWSIHPEYLDPKGLVALWREALLAQKVLHGSTKGYKNHPQLDRFKQFDTPLQAISSYLWAVADEADKRGYNFAREKILQPGSSVVIPVTAGQVFYEFNHLLAKLQSRKPEFFEALKNVKQIKTHRIFKKTAGAIESWEKV